MTLEFAFVHPNSSPHFIIGLNFQQKIRNKKAENVRFFIEEYEDLQKSMHNYILGLIE